MSLFPITADIVTRYENLEVSITFRDKELQDAMNDMHGLQDTLENTQAWLDDTDARLGRLVGAKVTVRKEPILEEIQNVKVRRNILCICVMEHSEFQRFH